MKTTERLKPGDSCTAADPGLWAKPMPGVVQIDHGKGYTVLRSHEATAKKFPNKKVKPARSAGAAPAVIRGGVAMAQDVVGTPARAAPIRFPKAWGEVVAQPKPEPPWRSEAFKAIVRAQPCCNCGAAPKSDPDHNGDRGVGQKCSDARCVGLCRKCHSIRTDTNCLPDPLDSKRKGKLVLRSREETADIIAKEQARILALVIEALPLAKRVELMAKAVESVEEKTLREVLR